MSTGFLMFPVGYAPTNDGAVVPGGKLYFYRTGTSTPQDTHSASALGAANANPVVLNTEGYLDTKVYGDPTTGFKYRVKLTDANDVQIWQVDDVTMGAADSAKLGGTGAASFPIIQTGSFTGTLTGFASNPSGTVNYYIVGNLCTLYVSSTISATSNANTMTMTGLPAAVIPSVTRNTPLFAATDNGLAVTSLGQISTGGVITFWTDEPLLSTGWTTSGTKGFGGTWNITSLL